MEEAASAGACVAKGRALLAAGFLVAVAGTAALAAPVVHQVGGPKALFSQAVDLVPRSVPAAQAERLVWQGADIDGDGQADFANPTGHDTRKTDAYGCGEFGAS